MEAWLAIVLRQIILYSLPVLVSLELVGYLEAGILRRKVRSFHAISWKGCWLPWLASIAFHRGIIIALPQPVGTGLRAAAIRLMVHAMLCGIGFLLYAWSLKHPPAVGLPPLHHWWAKVFMFFNLCMACMHLIPLPGLVLGEILSLQRHTGTWMQRLTPWHGILILTLLASSPLLDGILGRWVVFPIYEQLSIMAHAPGS